MRVLVCGGRDFRDERVAFNALDRLHEELDFEVVIHGCAGGADQLAGEWARHRRLGELRFPADWAKHGKAAGPIRNQQMLEKGKPDLVVAFPGGRGTADMVQRARRAGVDVMEVRP